MKMKSCDLLFLYFLGKVRHLCHCYYDMEADVKAVRKSLVYDKGTRKTNGNFEPFFSKFKMLPPTTSMSALKNTSSCLLLDRTAYFNHTGHFSSQETKIRSGRDLRNSHVSSAHNGWLKTYCIVS